ncbi:hypothetical protein [Paenibacillus spongiae]|uniref:Lipocalin-like domain-containing protein n=1 Tax=Paenibacillus spongiae TaxID=2909671 RepID=A0ABY5S7P2_9BACL|nr:hypothetical protein [Paenibacillus spongiae]UVI29600.1 hypothetical protein L1F29_29990 [Paenibacillus spongiae]
MKSIVGTIAALFAVSLLIGCNDAKKTEAAELKLEGNWKLAADSQSSACFTEMKFRENPTSDRDPLSVHETTGNITQIWFGEYEKEGNDIRVILREPKAEPFIMAADRSGNELKLKYEWKSAELVCSYQPD